MGWKGRFRIVSDVVDAAVVVVVDGGGEMDDDGGENLECDVVGDGNGSETFFGLLSRLLLLCIVGDVVGRKLIKLFR